MTDFNKALKDPTVFYHLPRDVLEDPSLTKEQKIKVLQQWEYDARELLVATEENMVGSKDGGLLDRVLEALHAIDPEYDSAAHPAPNKQGAPESGD